MNHNENLKWRDELATRAMVALASSSGLSVDEIVLARQAYKIADAMLDEAARRNAELKAQFPGVFADL